MRRRRDRVQQRRQKSILFSKSQELALLERLCRKVAGTLCDTSWDKLFVTDPDVVLASKPIKPHRKDARARGERTLKTQTRIKEHKCAPCAANAPSLPCADILRTRRPTHLSISKLHTHSIRVQRILPRKMSRRFKPSWKAQNVNFWTQRST